MRYNVGGSLLVFLYLFANLFISGNSVFHGVGSRADACFHVKISFF